MPHLDHLRKGWQSENLARLVLYNFAFVSEPSKVADDIGVDFFCTLFKRMPRTGGDADLVPKSSFAVQVKSDKRKLNLKKHLLYLNALEIPFFVAIVDKKKLSIAIYSGEYLPHFFSYFGFENELTHDSHNVTVNFCERSTFHPRTEWFTKMTDNDYTLKFPKMVEFDAKTIEQNLEQNVTAIDEIIQLMQANIALKKSGRSILLLFGGGYVPYMGRGSASAFEDNFYYGFIEAFYNLGNLAQYPPWHLKVQQLFPEFERMYKIYKRVYKKIGAQTPQLDLAYSEAKAKISP